MTDRQASLLIELGVPLTLELWHFARSLFANLERADVDPPWAVGVAVEVLRGYQGNPANAGNDEATAETDCKRAIRSYLASEGGRPTDRDVDDLYEAAVKRIRFELGLSTGGG